MTSKQNQEKANPSSDTFQDSAASASARTHSDACCLDGVIVPPGTEHPMLNECGEPVHTYTPASYVPYSPESFSNSIYSHRMRGKNGGLSVPQNANTMARRSMIEYLQQFQGAHLCLDLWSSAHVKFKKCGVLLEIGEDFLVIQDTSLGKISLIDLKPIRYINIYCK